ncbi:MAG: twin-arginine translocase TatA/TatE family subunit [Bacteroidetes bacterium]|nr:twin-arginine translocase TatA/TatE family subunit [Bacteroidota bacterium]
MGGIGAPELIIIFLVVLLVFGAKRIPEIARGLGKGIKEFKSATKDITSELNLTDVVNRIDAPRKPAQGTTAPRSDKAYQAPEPEAKTVAKPADQTTPPATPAQEQAPPPSNPDSGHEAST